MKVKIHKQKSQNVHTIHQNLYFEFAWEMEASEHKD